MALQTVGRERDKCEGGGENRNWQVKIPGMETRHDSSPMTQTEKWPNQPGYSFLQTSTRVPPFIKYLFSHA